MQTSVLVQKRHRLRERDVCCFAKGAWNVVEKGIATMRREVPWLKQKEIRGVVYGSWVPS